MSEISRSKSKKTDYLFIRITPNEKENIESAAQKKNLSISEYVRRVLKNPPEVTKYDFDYMNLHLMYEINKLGVNINQIAKKINSGYGQYGDVETIKKQMEQVEENMQKILDLEGAK